ncbi:MAG TPA: hypothetical protein VKV27_09175 [Solirubrobacteraceae bacterium]|nr:hypothetical protein [Solirubrobacteraceae bacterium]
MRSRASIVAPLLLAGGLAASLGTGLLALAAVQAASPPDPCSISLGPVAAAQQAGGQASPAGELVGATEYGGPGDPSSGTVGASGVNLVTHPDSYAELGGYTFQTADALGDLPYMTPLRITWHGHSAIAYKRDFGLGGGPIDGLPRAIDLWWMFARRLGIPYEDGLWSGLVRISRPPATGAGPLLGLTPAAVEPAAVDPAALEPAALEPAALAQAGAGPAAFGPAAGAAAGAPCPAGPPPADLPVVPGSRAVLLSNGLAAAPADAPPAVAGIIAAGNQIVGKPYLYGGGHGLPLDEVAPAYDCSSSVEHLLWGGGLLPVDYDAPSGTLESFGLPGPGRWVTIYASADHVFMYVAGLRWDTWNAAGPGDGTAGIGWHPLVRDAAGFVVRHPAGL